MQDATSDHLSAMLEANADSIVSTPATTGIGRCGKWRNNVGAWARQLGSVNSVSRDGRARATTPTPLRTPLFITCLLQPRTPAAIACVPTSACGRPISRISGVRTLTSRTPAETYRLGSSSSMPHILQTNPPSPITYSAVEQSLHCKKG